jgi:UDP-glucose 4-epimerase
MNIFVTGGAGYIGSAAVEALQTRGHAVTVYDSLVTGHRAAMPPSATFIQGDLADRHLLEALAGEKYDAIMHFAAFIEAGESMNDPGKFLNNNLVNSLSLIETATKIGIKKFVLSSTAAIYATSDKPLSEESPIEPANVYGFTKLAIEQTLEWYRMHYTALRYFNACGAMPGRGEAHKPESHLIPRVLQTALGQLKNLSIFGDDYPTQDGTCIRDYIHIGDLITAHMLALDALEREDKLIYNLGNGAGYSVKEVIETARKVTGCSIEVTTCPRRPGDTPRLVASSEKIQRELGWIPQHPDLESIIASAWEWHSSHPEGYA